MKDIPANNGKDVRKFTTFKDHTLSGVSRHIKFKNGDTPKPYEPKRNNRWLIKFVGAYKDIQSWTVIKTHRPKLVNGNWSNFKITLRDVIGPSTSQALIDGFRYEWQVKYNKIPRIEYSLEMLDPTGVTIESWLIKGEVINADFGKLNYKNDKLSEIKLEIKPSSVILLY